MRGRTVQDDARFFERHVYEHLWSGGVRVSRLKTGRVVNSLLGIELFEDTQILRIALIPAHYLAVGPPDFNVADSDADFPLAGLDQPDAPNATIMIVLLRLHPGEPMTGAFQFRYHHRDSVSPDDGLDLNRRRYFEKQGDPDMVIAGFAALLPVVGEPTILDVSDLDVRAALNAIKATPLVFSRPTSTEWEAGGDDGCEQEDSRSCDRRAALRRILCD